MTRTIALVLALVAGGMVALQPAVNSQLARATSVLAAAFISFAIGALALGVVLLLSGGIGRVSAAPSVPVGYLTGGLLGVILVTASLVAVRELGAGGVVAATVSTQLIVSALLDRAGVLGLDRVALTPIRVGGFVLLLTGTLMVTLR